ncbi:MAG: hypothetical protein HQK66_10390 [Desulfamplus sp.]|nr:hypothetical protein [Desulfamplus sp.]
MEPVKIAKQMIGFQKTLFNNSFNAMVVVQDQTENMLTGFMGQLPWINEDGKKQINETLALTKKARDEFKKSVDEGYVRFEQMFEQK